jgi:hypothetical protein
LANLWRCALDVPGQGGVDWNGGVAAAAAARCGVAALPASRVGRRRLWGWGGAAR